MNGVKRELFPEEGGIHPRLAAEHHAEWIPKLIPQAIEESGLSYGDIDLISFSKRLFSAIKNNFEIKVNSADKKERKHFVLS